MKNVFKRIAASVAAVAVIGTAGLSVSAATKDDVVAAARSAGFQEVYVQQLISFLRANKFSSSQYDIMVEKLLTVGSEMDDFALKHWGKTVAQMKGEAENDPSKPQLPDILQEIDDQEILGMLDEIIQGGKDIGLDISVEKKGEKNFVVTVKDKDGNIQFVTPVGKLVDRTGAEGTESDSDAIPAVCAGVAAAGCIGAYVIIAKCSKRSDKMRKKNG